MCIRVCICNYGGVSVITVYLCVSVCVSVTIVVCLLSRHSLYPCISVISAVAMTAGLYVGITSHHRNITVTTVLSTTTESKSCDKYPAVRIHPHILINLSSLVASLT